VHSSVQPASIICAFKLLSEGIVLMRAQLIEHSSGDDDGDEDDDSDDDGAEFKHTHTPL